MVSNTCKKDTYHRFEACDEPFSKTTLQRFGDWIFPLFQKNSVKFKKRVTAEWRLQIWSCFENLNFVSDYEEADEADICILLPDDAQGAEGDGHSKSTLVAEPSWVCDVLPFDLFKRDKVQELRTSSTEVCSPSCSVGRKEFKYWIVLVTTKHVVPFCSKKKRCRVCMFSRWFSNITLGLSTQTSDVCFLKTAALQKNYVSVKVGIAQYRLRRLRCWSSKSDSIPLDEINKSWLTICRFQKLGIKRSTTEINPSPSPMHLKSKCEVCICKTQDTLLCLSSSFSNVICHSSGFFIQIESTQNERSTQHTTTDYRWIFNTKECVCHCLLLRYSNFKTQSQTEHRITP